MFELYAERAELCVRPPVPKLTSGAVNAFFCRFTFGAGWEGLAKTAVFQVGGCATSVPLDGTGICAVPWEALRHKNCQLMAGVYGTKDGAVVLPTVWASLGTIRPGAETGIPAMPHTPGAYEALLALIGDLSALETEAKDNLVNAVNEAAKGGGAVYVHEQPVPAAVWSIQHGLGKKCPNLICLDRDGNRIFGDPEYFSDNLLRIRFSQPLSGSACLT